MSKHRDEEGWKKSAAWLESHQAETYRRLGINPPSKLDFDDDALRKAVTLPHMQRALKELGGSEEELFRELKSRRTAAFAAMPTRFENPDYYSLITSIASEVEESLELVGRSLHHSPLFGTLPSGRVNGIAVSVPDTPHRLVILEDGLFGFTNLMCKAVASAFPDTEPHQDGKLGFSADENDVMACLAANPEVTNRFFEALVAYVVMGHPHKAPPYVARRNAMHLGAVLRESMQLFVIGHEYGHIVSGHLDGGKVSKQMVADGKMNIVATNWMQEIEADAIGLEVLGNVRMRQGYDLPLSLWGADAFFGCVDVVERTVSILREGEISTRFSDSHPPTPLRREKIRQIISDNIDDEGKVEAILQLSKSVEIVIESIWKSIQPAIEKMYADGIKPSPGW